VQRSAYGAGAVGAADIVRRPALTQCGLAGTSVQFALTDQPNNVITVSSRLCVSTALFGRTRSPAGRNLGCEVRFVPKARGELVQLATEKRERKPRFKPDAFLEKAGEGRTVSKFQKDQVVFSQGEAADSVFYIQKGKVKITVVSKQGKEAIVAILGRGDFCGEGCLAGQPRRIATIKAMTECVMMRLDKTAMIRVLRDEPAFSEMFVSHLLARNIRVEADLIDQLFNSSEQRLARLLLLLVNFGKEGTPEPIIPKISQETLAEMVGTTRSRVSHFMNKFRRLGFIDYSGGGVQVHRSLLNVVLHD
jgi:CRP/FNR family cyclic AMP-dependent transcriptional regulator